MSARHTPGPLVFGCRRTDSLPYVIQREGSNRRDVLAWVECEGDARLWALAPELLAALREMVKQANESHTPGERGALGRSMLFAAISMANTYIARAEGGGA